MNKPSYPKKQLSMSFHQHYHLKKRVASNHLVRFAPNHVKSKLMNTRLCIIVLSELNSSIHSSLPLCPLLRLHLPDPH